MADYTSKFDGVDLEAVCVPVADLPEPQLEENIKAAFDVAFENIRKFHEAQKVRARGKRGGGCSLAAAALWRVCFVCVRLPQRADLPCPPTPRCHRWI